MGAILLITCTDSEALTQVRYNTKHKFVRHAQKPMLAVSEIANALDPILMSPNIVILRRGPHATKH